MNWLYWKFVWMLAYIMKTQFFVDMFCYSFLRPSALITTFTYVLMDNFCPCFIYLDMIIIAYLSMFWFIKWIIFTINTIILLSFKRSCTVKKVYLLLDYNLFLLIIFHLKPNLIRHLSNLSPLAHVRFADICHKLPLQSWYISSPVLGSESSSQHWLVL